MAPLVHVSGAGVSGRGLGTFGIDGVGPGIDGVGSITGAMGVVGGGVGVVHESYRYVQVPYETVPHLSVLTVRW